MTHKLQVQIVSVSPEAVESLVVIDSKDIVAVSKISAEDRARRYFRKQAVPMASVVREVVSADEECWTGYANGLPEDKKVVRKARKASAPKVTADEVFAAVEFNLDDMFGQWAEEKGTENANWDAYVSTAKGMIEGANAKFVNFTSRPFQLTFKISDVEYIVGRNRNGAFELKA